MRLLTFESEMYVQVEVSARSVTRLSVEARRASCARGEVKMKESIGVPS
jgi:hypothetical protein